MFNEQLKNTRNKFGGFSRDVSIWRANIRSLALREITHKGFEELNMVRLMPTFVVNMKHTPESCPRFNEEVRKKFKDVIMIRKDAGEKYGVNIFSAYASTIEHKTLYIVEASSLKSIENYFIEIGFAFWNAIDISHVIPIEDVIRKITE